MHKRHKMKIYTYELEKKPRMNTNGHECRIRGVESQKVKKSKGEIRKCVDARGKSAGAQIGMDAEMHSSFG